MGSMNRKKWQEVYMFMYDSKMTAGIYFVAFIFFYLGFGAFDPNRLTTLDFWTSIQMFMACLLIGFGQRLLLYKHKVSLVKIILWSIWSLVVTILFSEGLEWFDTYPEWYRFVFYSLITISFFFYWLALDLKLKKETKILNSALDRFKEKIRDE